VDDAGRCGGPAARTRPHAPRRALAGTGTPGRRAAHAGATLLGAGPVCDGHDALAPGAVVVQRDVSGIDRGRARSRVGTERGPRAAAALSAAHRIARAAGQAASGCSTPTRFASRLAHGDVHAAACNEHGAQIRIGVGRLAPEDPSQNRGPDQARVVERRDHGCRADTESLRDERQPQRAEQRDATEIRQVFHGRRAPHPRQSNRAAHQLAQHDVEGGGQHAFGAVDAARRDHHDRVEQGGGQRQQGGGLEGLRARAHHDQHARKARQYRQPALAVDTFLKDQHRQRGDEQRRGKRDGGGFGQRQRLQSKIEATGRDHVDGAARQVQAGMRRAQHAASAQPQRERGHERQRDQRAQEEDLHIVICFVVSWVSNFVILFL